MILGKNCQKDVKGSKVFCEHDSGAPPPYSQSFVLSCHHSRFRFSVLSQTPHKKAITMADIADLGRTTGLRACHMGY